MPFEPGMEEEAELQKKRPKYPTGQGTQSGGNMQGPPGGPQYPAPPPSPGQGLGQITGGGSGGLEQPDQTPPPWDPNTFNNQPGDYGEHINAYLDSVFGSDRSFDPYEETWQRETDAGARMMAERAASMGGANSGVLGSQLGGFYNEATNNLAKQQMEWENNLINQQHQAAQFLFQERFQNLSYEQQMGMAKLMAELERQKMFGKDYNPNIGLAEAQFMYQAMMEGNMPPDIQEYVRSMMTDLYGEENVNTWEQGSAGRQPGGGEAGPKPGIGWDGPWKYNGVVGWYRIGADGNTYNENLEQVN
jgi:hypothetical protein